MIICWGHNKQRQDVVTLPLSYSTNYVILGSSIYNTAGSDYTECFYNINLSNFTYYADPNAHWDAVEINWITLGF